MEPDFETVKKASLREGGKGFKNGRLGNKKISANKTLDSYLESRVFVLG